MNVKLLVGIALFLMGFLIAVAMMAGVGANPDEPLIVTQDNASESVLQTSRTYVLPAVAALSMAIGGLLMGVSLGNWKNPRKHLEPGDEVVDPEGYHKMNHV